MLFRVGDYVEPVRNSNRVRKGEVYRVTRVSSISNWLKLEGFNGMFNPSLFKLYKDNSRDEYWELVEDKDKYPNGKHPHHDLILEYAKGAEIEFFSTSVNAWRNVLSPAFAKDTLYRVKPQQDPAVQAAKKKIEQAEQMLREANDELDRLGL